ncbi:MAG TPA: hypothetical protein VFE25_12220 [Opitutaceae bacterium]|jgi:hypothetical protein|nr:hypothetical protein [Opitutaceae bacterium]
MTTPLLPPRATLWIALAVASLGLAATAQAKNEEWKDPKGNTFEAMPSQILGPWALFDTGTLIPLNALSKEDCIRFYQGLKDKPERASDWKDAKSNISAELYGRLMHYKGYDLEKDSEKGRVEPELYMIFFTTNDKNMTWKMLRNETPDLYAKMMHDHPETIQGVIFGVGEEIGDHMDLAVNTHGDWMYTEFATEVEMRTLKRLIPTNLYGIVVMTRDGIPLFGPDASNEEQIKTIFDQVNGMLVHVEDKDIRDWKARDYYYTNVQPVAFASGHSDPLLMGNPLRDAVLRKMKIYNVDATFHVKADGTITSVNMKPGELAPDMEKKFADGFQRGCLFVPAVDNGKFVDGTYEYHMAVTP